jgi:hypothetical protein
MLFWINIMAGLDYVFTLLLPSMWVEATLMLKGRLLELKSAHLISTLAVAQTTCSLELISVPPACVVSSFTNLHRTKPLCLLFTHLSSTWAPRPALPRDSLGPWSLQLSLHARVPTSIQSVFSAWCWPFPPSAAGAFPKDEDTNSSSSTSSSRWLHSYPAWVSRLGRCPCALGTRLAFSSHALNECTLASAIPLRNFPKTIAIQLAKHTSVSLRGNKDSFNAHP